MAKPNDTSFSISIHALRKEGDRRSGDGQCRPANFYPRPPRGGRLQQLPQLDQCIRKRFLSTPSARRATSHSLHPLPCQTISIHALREEGDLSYPPKPKAAGLFLSTPSARRATSCRVGRLSFFHYFYPRPPRGGRHSFSSLRSAQRDFYPRPPRGGRPRYFCDGGGHRKISIHALREEGDRTLKIRGRVQDISIHALREEGDLLQCRLCAVKEISIHALREEGDTPV